MSTHNAHPFLAAPAPVAEDVPSPETAQQAATPMSMSYLLNPSNPAVDVDMHDVSPAATAPSAPVPTGPATSPATLGENADDKVSVQDRDISPAPSTGDAPGDAAPYGAGVGSVEPDDNDTEMTGGSASDGGSASHGATVRTFKCMNDEFEECRTGQTTMDLSRKVISDHFGRNKACTRLITDWPLFCRKHYQRATYNQKLWQARKITLILRQFDIIEKQFPGTRYTVALKKSEEQRLNTFSRKIASGKTEEEAAALVAPKKDHSKHFEAPVNVLREIEQLNYLGEDKTKAEVEQAVTTIRDMLEAEDTEQVPSIEFLPQLEDPVAPKSRISKKGAITKSSAKKSGNKSRSPKSTKKGTKASV